MNLNTTRRDWLKTTAAAGAGFWLGSSAKAVRACSALETLKRWGVRRLKLCSVIAAPEGVHEVERHHPEAQIYVCSIDECLNAQKFIVPGLGDAGDRTFNTLSSE